jgi:ATP-dependent exoDNAse (exonuclease V) beta subunit
VLPGLDVVDERVKAQERSYPQRVGRVLPTAQRPQAPARVIGLLVHEALSAWRFPDDDSEGDFDEWARTRAREHGVIDERQLRHAASQSRQLLLRFQRHWLWQEMTSADRRLHEVPYDVEADGQTESGIIDALFLREGAWTIVEFKTDRVTDNASFEKLLARDDHHEQARRYADAAERLLGQRPRTILCMLNYAGQVHTE